MNGMTPSLACSNNRIGTTSPPDRPPCSSCCCCCSKKSVDSNSNRCNVKINASSDLSDHITTRKHKEKVNVKSISSQTNTMESKKSHLSPIKSADKKDQKKEKLCIFVVTVF